MRRAILPVLAATVLVPAASSLAQDQDQGPPARKPGWWEMQLVISGPTAEPIRQTRRVCTDAAFDKVDSPLGVNMSGAGCQPKVARTAAGWSAGGTCDTGQMKITANAVATGDFNDRYHVDIDVRMDPPPQPQVAVVKIGLDAHWIGQCPAGKKPGDTDAPPAAPAAGN